MATLVQAGYLGSTGPVFVDTSTVAGKNIVLVGNVANGVVTYVAKTPAYATNLRNSTAGADHVFPYPAEQCSLGPYSDNQVIVMSPSYKVPSTGTTFDYYLNVADSWVAGTATANTTGGGGGSTGTTTTTGGSTTTGGTTTTTTGGTTVTTTDTTYKAPTITEQITTFLSNYWWLVLLIAIALLYKPVIAPALGLSKKKRSYR